MKRSVVLAIGVLALTTGLVAQRGRSEPPPPPPPLEPGASQADVDLALLAAPASLKDQATVIKWKKDFTYDTLRKGTNRLVCYDRSGFPLQQPFSVQCTSVGNLEREAQNLKAEAAGDRPKSEATLAEMEKGGTRAKPEYGSMWYAMAGPDREHARPESHITIAVPFATSQSIGLPNNGRQGGAWIMNEGTMKAHIMVPNR
jgi:hypothetical protein